MTQLPGHAHRPLAELRITGPTATTTSAETLTALWRTLLLLKHQTTNTAEAKP